MISHVLNAFVGPTRGFLCLVLVVLFHVSAGNALATVFVYEAQSMPEVSGWQTVQIYCNPLLSIQNGWLYEIMDVCPGVPPPGGQQATYRREIAEFSEAANFFVEWRVQTSAQRSELDWGGGAAISAASHGDVNYAFKIAADRAELNRDNLLPLAVADIDAGVPHTYRLELVGAVSYVWYIDGQEVDSGSPEGNYPSAEPFLVWRANVAFLPSTTQWDYIRYGTIPADGSGDFDSNGAVDANDVYFFLDCLLGPDSAGPGCRWADMNHDGAANAADIQQFVAALVK